jgi:acylphosphatase
MNKRIEATIHGRVQGVAFRHYTSIQAHRLGVCGWVANRPDGTVRVVAEGDERVLKHFCEWLHEGPSAARVAFVDLIWLDATDEFRDFTIRG